jgi:hypothetical protein
MPPATADFCLAIGFEPGTESPARVFHALIGLINACQGLDAVLTKSVDVSIEPVLLLEDIEVGSLRVWLRTVLQAVPDDALKDLNWKKGVGEYLVRAKWAVIDWTGRRSEVTDRAEVLQLGADLAQLAEDTDVRHIPAYAPPDLRGLLAQIARINAALSHLRSGDRADFFTREADAVPFNVAFSIVPERIDELLTQETIANETTKILKVKKPDYLGDSQWEFRHEGRIVHARIEHGEWLQRFRRRELDVRPGDALRCRVRTEVRYGYDGEAIGSIETVLEVLEILSPLAPQQLALP